MKQWLIVAELPEPLRSELHQLRSELDIWNMRWLPPHVTIIRPFAAELRGAMISEIVRPINVTAQILKWAIFRNPENNVLYLEPTQQPFQQLRADVLRRLPDITKGDRSVDPYQQFADQPIFHISLATSVPNDEINRIYSKVSQKTYMNVFQIHKLSLYSKESEGFWQLEG